MTFCSCFFFYFCYSYSSFLSSFILVALVTLHTCVEARFAEFWLHKTYLLFVLFSAAWFLLLRRQFCVETLLSIIFVCASCFPSFFILFLLLLVLPLLLISFLFLLFLFLVFLYHVDFLRCLCCYLQMVVFWNLSMHLMLPGIDACLTIMHLINTTGSIPYGV